MDTTTENKDNVVNFGNVSVAGDLKPAEPVAPKQTFQEWIEAKWDKQLTDRSLGVQQCEAQADVAAHIKSCVNEILRIVPICQETDRALGQIEVALLLLNKAIALHPELKTQEPK